MGNLCSSSSIKTEKDPPSTTFFDCEICTETVPQTKRFHNKKTCSHPFCVDCIARHIKTKVEDDKTGDIKCPDMVCGSSLEPLTCRPIVAPNVFVTWCDVLFESLLLRSPKTFYCPFRDCSALLWNECGNAKKSCCPVCKKLFCFHCRRPWHAGYSCNEMMTPKDRNDLLFGELVEANRWARCPVCRHCVSRTEGCKYIKCRCGVSFCYICGRRDALCSCGLSPWFFCCCCGLCVFILAVIIVVIFLCVHFLS